MADETFRDCSYEFQCWLQEILTRHLSKYASIAISFPIVETKCVVLNWKEILKKLSSFLFWHHFKRISKKNFIGNFMDVFYIQCTLDFELLLSTLRMKIRPSGKLENIFLIVHLQIISFRYTNTCCIHAQDGDSTMIVRGLTELITAWW